MSTKNRGFAAMDPKRRAEIASMGGRAAHAAGTAHEFDSQSARRAARKGVVARRERKTLERIGTPLPASEEQILSSDTTSTSELPDA